MQSAAHPAVHSTLQPAPQPDIPSSGPLAAHSGAHAAIHAETRSAPLPPPYQLAIEDTAFQITVLADHVPRPYDCDCALLPASWFSVVLMASTQKRYLYLVQKETDTGLVVLILLYDRSALAEETHGLRLPPSGAWMRAVVDGTVHVLASDLVLTRKAITAWIGGHEPPTIPAMPPYR